MIEAFKRGWSDGSTLERIRTEHGLLKAMKAYDLLERSQVRHYAKKSQGELVANITGRIISNTLGIGKWIVTEAIRREIRPIPSKLVFTKKQFRRLQRKLNKK